MSILIVEDEFIVANNLKIIVEKLGYSICGIAPSGISACNVVADNGCDLKVILMDITLRGDMDGIETAERLRKKHRVPLVYITGNKDSETLNRAIRNTAPFAIINKPFNVGIIESVIQKAFNQALDAEDGSPEYERRESPRLKAVGFPWERVYLSTEASSAHEESVILDNISVGGIGVMSEAVFHYHLKYRTRIVLPSPWGTVSGIVKLRHSRQRDGLIYYGFALVLNSRDSYVWKQYIEHQGGSGPVG